MCISTLSPRPYSIVLLALTAFPKNFIAFFFGDKYSIGRKMYLKCLCLCKCELLRWWVLGIGYLEC